MSDCSCRWGLGNSAFSNESQGGTSSLEGLNNDDMHMKSHNSESNEG